jgi:aldehyde dehydrogenase
MNQALIEQVVQQVIAELAKKGGSASGGSSGSGSSSKGPRQGAFGIFSDVNEAVAAASLSQRKLMTLGMEGRATICQMLRDIPRANDQAWAKMELEETKVGRLDHKIAKLHLLAKIPGVEFLQAAAHSGDAGISLDEMAPWGVIGAITPVTHSVPTLTANAINMIAAGNAMVINPHPSGAACAAEAVKTYNQAIASKLGIENLICLINPPTLESADTIFKHPDVPLLVITGGPAVARAAMNQPKRAIVGGPGNPPVVIDETADLDRAARSIIQGAGFDNNLLCIGEKEVFVVESVFDAMLEAMTRAGGIRLSAPQIDKLTKAAFAWKDNHWAVQKALVGKDTSLLAQAAGVEVMRPTDLLFGETDESNPFVAEEQMMPFVPFVRVRNFDEALEMAIRHEHGFGHTAIIHSNNLKNITTMGRACNTTIFVANGPSTAGLGIGGEGYPSYTIATPTGEGITNPATFTRFRRMSVSGSLRIV